MHLDLDPAVLPIDYVLMIVAIPDGASLFDAPDDLRSGRELHFGDEWIRQKQSLLLRVPSVVMPQLFNVLLNPAHAEAEQISLAGVDALNFDARLAG